MLRIKKIKVSLFCTIYGNLHKCMYSHLSRYKLRLYLTAYYHAKSLFFEVICSFFAKFLKQIYQNT